MGSDQTWGASRVSVRYVDRERYALSVEFRCRDEEGLRRLLAVVRQAQEEGLSVLVTSSAAEGAGAGG